MSFEKNAPALYDCSGQMHPPPGIKPMPEPSPKKQAQNFLNPRLAISGLMLLILLILIHTQLDLRPNTILVEADLQNHYLPPEVKLNRGTGFTGPVFSSGQISTEPFDDLKALQITVSRKPLLTSNDFLLIDYARNQAFETSTWTATFPPFQFDGYQTLSLVFSGPKPDANYEVIAGGQRRTTEQVAGLLYAQHPDPESGISGTIQVKIQQPLLDNPIDVRQLKPGFEYVFLQPSEPTPLKLASVRLDKTFGLLGLQIPMWTWEPEAILLDFAVRGLDSGARVEGNLLLIEPGTDPETRLVTSKSLSAVRQTVEDRIQTIRLGLTLTAVAGTGLLYLVLSWFSVLVSNYSQQNAKLKKKAYGVLCHLQANRRIPTEIVKKSGLSAVLGVLLVSAFTAQLGMIPGLLLLIALGIVSLVWGLVKRRLSGLGVLTWISRAADWVAKQHLLIMLLLVVVGAALLFFRLGEHDFYEDEFQVISAAAGFLHSGEFQSWDWIGSQVTGSIYDRAWPHTWLIAQSFRVFGVSEWSARLVSALFGVGFLIGLYFFARYFANIQVALLSLLSAAFYLTFINIFRKTRMYAMLLPIFLLLTYLIYRGLTGDWVPKTKIKFLDKFLQKYLNFDYRYILFALPIFFLNYHIHLNSLVIVLATFIFICWMAIVEKSSKYRVLVWLGLAGLLGLLLVDLFDLPIRLPWVLDTITLLEQRNDIYFQFLFRYPFGMLTGSLLVIYIVYRLIKTKPVSQKQIRLMYLLVITITSALFFSYFADRYSSFVYISHVVPLALILIMAGVWKITARWLSQSTLLKGATVILVLVHFLMGMNAFFNWERSYGDYSTAYQIIVENYDDENEVIFGQYLRTYYLQPLNQINHISMLNRQRYSYDQFLADLEQQPSGWIVWETRKAYHIEPQILTFIDTHFIKLHGEGIDNTMVEVYYYSYDPPAWLME